MHEEGCALVQEEKSATITQANVTIMVRDVKKAVEFYTATLGLKLRARYGEEFAQVEAPGTIIALHPSHKESQNKEEGHLSIGFAVDNLEETMAELRNKGVTFSSVRDDTQVRLAFFADADGTPLYLSQSKWTGEAGRSS